MSACNPVSVPIGKLTVHIRKVTDFPHKSAVGALLFLACGTHLNISFWYLLSVFYTGISPTPDDETQVVRVLRYYFWKYEHETNYCQNAKSKDLKCYSNTESSAVQILIFQQVEFV